jgi:hypothetical protein
MKRHKRKKKSFYIFLALVHGESKAKAEEDFLANSSLYFANISVHS